MFSTVGAVDAANVMEDYRTLVTDDRLTADN